MKRLELSELIFKILAYTLLCVFALMCLYPFVYSVSAAISGREAYETGKVLLLPSNIQFGAFRHVFTDGMFWVTYANTLFVTFYGALWSVTTSILGAYALSKKRLMFRRGLNFFLVFTLWFTAGLVPQLLNFQRTRDIFDLIGGALGTNYNGHSDDKWLVVIAMGMGAFNVILLRNAFEAVPKEIEEAAKVDGATELQLLRKVYLPMSKATIATVTLFFAISRWNGYFWANMMIRETNQMPLQVYIKRTLDAKDALATDEYAGQSIMYAMIVCAIIPIIIIYPYIQKYFAKGVNMGGVKE